MDRFCWTPRGMALDDISGDHVLAADAKQCIEELEELIDRTIAWDESSLNKDFETVDNLVNILADMRKAREGNGAEPCPQYAEKLKHIEELERLATQRGARMQIMREWMCGNEWPGYASIWQFFLRRRQEAANWFDEDGVPTSATPREAVSE